MSKLDRALRSNLKLRHLQLLVALDEFRHLGRAAEFLSVTQPAVSKTLAEVERTFDLSLFERSSRGTQPTTYGESVVRFARSVLANYERTRDELAAVASGAAGRTSVGAMVVATPVLLTRAVNMLKSASPQTTVLVDEGDLQALLPKLRVGELDLFAGRLEPAYAAPDLETEALYNEPMTVIAHPHHALAKRRTVKWTDLANVSLVVPPPWASLRVKLDKLLLQNGLREAVDVIETASFLGTVAFVRERPAIGFLARSVSQSFEREGLIKVLPLAVPVDLPPIGIMTLRAQRRTPATERLIDCLRRVGQELAQVPAAARAAQRKRS